MSYKILSFNPRRNTHHFFIDTTEDLQILPQKSGSTALIATTGETYICNNNKQWIIYNINNSCSCNYGNSNNIQWNGLSYISQFTLGRKIKEGFRGCEFYFTDDETKLFYAREDDWTYKYLWKNFNIPQKSTIKVYFDANYLTNNHYTIQNMQNWILQINNQYISFIVQDNIYPVFHKDGNSQGTQNYWCIVFQLPPNEEIIINLQDDTDNVE